MHAIALHTLRTASRPFLSRSACRIVAGTRHPISRPRARRSFHASSTQRADLPTAGSGLPEETGKEEENAAAAKRNGASVEPEVKDEIVDGGIDAVEDTDAGLRKGGRIGRATASKRAKASKTAAKTGLPPVPLPRGYWNRCVLCAEEKRTFGELRRVYIEDEIESSEARASGSALNALQDGAVQPGMEGEKPVVDANLTKIAPTKESILEAGVMATEAQIQYETQVSNQTATVNPSKRPIDPAELQMVEDLYEEVETTYRRLKRAKRFSDADAAPKHDGYSINDSIYFEVYSTLQSGLNLPPPTLVKGKDISRPLPLLVSNQEGGHDFLNSVVESVAQHANCDLVRLDANDLAECLGEYIGENVAWQESRVAVLGYEMGSYLRDTDKDDSKGPPFAVIGSPENLSEEDDALTSGLSQPISATVIGDLMKNLSGLRDRSKQKLKPVSSSSGAGSNMMFSFPFGKPTPKTTLGELGPDNWTDLKTNAALERLIQGADERAAELAVNPETTEAPPRSLIIQIQDYSDIMLTDVGADLISKLQVIVDRRWRDGRKIICVGTHADKEIDAWTRADIKQLEAEDEGEARTIYIPTEPIDPSSVFKASDKARIRSINVRHIEDMTRAMTKGMGEDISIEIEKEVKLFEEHKSTVREFDGSFFEDTLTRLNFWKEHGYLLDDDGTEATLIFWVTAKTAHLDELNAPYELRDSGLTTIEVESSFSKLEKSVWSLADVRRVVTVMLGMKTEFTSQSQPIGAAELHKALVQLKESDTAKYARGKAAWAAKQEQRKAGKGGIGSSKDLHAEKLAELSKTCTTHEKKMFKGIVAPADIKTTFGDIRAPEDTIEALKTLTGLSLLRPEAFSYGVLATDKIPGLLLYGPPGTGKTLLARAVAKESGATVLEISGADVNDMYVGEGEKNVKAVFTLAKKLSPCIVFIDEADAIFAARGQAGKQRSHRELINQFLREWDGMKDMGTFIMIATNRPFDLDDAVLRRLPRRLLVDLPVEKDREAILKIHLKDEILSENISLAALAKDTPFYSGSDLKNVCVAAALACIREENAQAAKWTGEGKYVYPLKRTLTKVHFKKALDEISASISEDMSTLEQIRKFDERYGDRKGRRKKKAGMGFGVAQVVEKDSDAVRVRNIDL